jgi:hypothetical protein
MATRNERLTHLMGLSELLWDFLITHIPSLGFVRGSTAPAPKSAPAKSKRRDARDIRPSGLNSNSHCGHNKCQ